MSEQWKPSSAFSVEMLADYVEGMVSPVVAANIESHLALHAEDAAVVEGIRHFLAQPGNTRDELDAWLTRTEAAQATSFKQKTGTIAMKPAWPRYIAIAATISLLALALGWWLWPASRPQSTEEWQAWADVQLEEIYPGPTATRGGDASSAANALIAAARQAYNQADWVQATAYYHELSLLLADSLTSGDRFYWALAQLYDGKATAETEARLTQLGNGPSAFAAPARYYAVMLALQSGRTEYARTLARTALAGEDVFRRENLEALVAE